MGIDFDDEHTSFEMRAALAKLQKEYLIDMEDVVVVTKNDKGKVKLHQAMNLTAAGAVGGSFWGTLAYRLWEKTYVGLEYYYGRREDFDGQSGHNNRLSLVFHHNFNR